MARNWLRINHEGDAIQLSWQRGQSNPRPAPSVRFTHPFDEQALADLRWYLEEYLRFPYGLAADNAAKIEQKFQDWGEQLFELVFRSSEKTREFFQAATYEGLNQCELVITSDNPEVLNLPWELLYSPSDRQFLAPSLAGMSRSLSEYAVRAEMGDLPQDKLNILLVIARPYGEKDIALRTIARPLLEAISNIRKKVNLKVLRPPSFEQFERELNAHRGFYHIVHFDGHGDFDPNSIGFQHTLGAAGQGLLVFEKNDGSPQIVTAAQIAQNLADCRVPIFVLNACKSAQEGIEAFLEPTVSNLVGFPEEGAYGFIGRDYDILQLERAFRQNNIVLLQGMAGVGKTELTCGFARWLDQTQGRTGKMFFISFEQGATLSNVVNQVGREVWGDKFAQYRAEQQQQAVLKYLKTQPSLLIWDNFEPVAGFPAGNEPLLNVSERDSLQRFLKDLRGGKSWVLITSRREERWLDCGYRLLDLRELREQDVEELAAKILQTAGVDRAKLSSEYLELLKLLGGHPLSLRVVLPHLKMQKPVQVIEALRLGLDTFQGAEEEARDKSLSVSIDYSFHKLSERTRRHLPFLALFSKQVSASFLYFFLAIPDSSFGQKYRAVFGENLQKEDWLRILNEAVEAGILENSQQGLYEIHPSLPWYMRRWLSEYHSQTAINELENSLLVFYALAAEQWSQMLVSDPGRVSEILLFEEQNLLKSFQSAEQQQNWEIAHVLLIALGKVYQLRSRESEFKVLRQRILGQIGQSLTQAKTKGESASRFWMYLQGVDANEARERGDLSAASRIYQELLDEAIRLNNAEAIATEYIHLGIVAYEQQDFDRATEYYQEALKVTETEDAGNSHNYALIYDELGMVAERKQKIEEAISYYQKALKLAEDDGDLQQAAREYERLGIVAVKKGDCERAIDCYQEALQIYEYAGNYQRAASVYHELGIVARIQQNFERAIDYYQKSLKASEDTGNLRQAANVYGELGNLAKDQHDFESAIAYYQKALQIFETVRDNDNVASTYFHLGSVAQKQRQLEDASTYYQKALQIFEAVGDNDKAIPTYLHLLVIAGEQQQFEQAMFFIKGLGQMLKKMGKSQFDTIFREVMDQDCPEELRSLIQAASEEKEE